MSEKVMKFAGLKVGDEVAISEHRGTSIRKVAKVGRKWFECERSSRGTKFSLKDGRNGTDYSYPSARTLEAYNKQRAAEKAKGGLKAFGVTFDYNTTDAKALLVYEALKAAGHLPAGSE